jgi:hypothetical protein
MINDVGKRENFLLSTIENYREASLMKKYAEGFSIENEETTLESPTLPPGITENAHSRKEFSSEMNEKRSIGRIITCKALSLPPSSSVNISITLYIATLQTSITPSPLPTPLSTTFT